jgi:hypothetical protein
MRIMYGINRCMELIPTGAGTLHSTDWHWENYLSSGISFSKERMMMVMFEPVHD